MINSGAEVFLSLVGLAFFILALTVVLAVMSSIIRQRSYYYRKYLVNMYVAGRIKQLAEKEKVDITEQEKNFLKYDKLSTSRRIKDLDQRIEDELSDKIESEKNK